MATATEERIAQLIEEERQRLLEEAGLATEPDHFRRPAERDFTKEERAHTTLLMGGLTIKHDQLVKAAFRGLGYKCENMPVPDVASFQTGKEYGNNGQCNPTYFTVGNLVKWLQEKRDAGIPKNELIENYVFLTAGACGPCRFGMYEAEYRLALRNAGFDGFRVILFQQKGGLTQSEVEAGLNMNFDFFVGLLGAIMIGDLLNEIGYQLRPYEIEDGATDRALAGCTTLLQEMLRSRDYWDLAGSRFRFLGKWKWTERKGQLAGKFLQELSMSPYRETLEKCRAHLAAVQVDRTRVCPTVKITGEFWAQTTEGDGNFNMFRFLQGEGAEVLVEPVATWLLYMLWQVKMANKDRFGLKGHRNPLRHAYKQWRIGMASKLLTKQYNKHREALGGTTHEPVCQMHMERLGHPYYHSRSQGGEGHLEVAKNIYYSAKKLCHMVLSLKPFGCMPSTQSDGTQAAVTSHHGDMIYLPIETSGEGEINAHSRVQMALGEARRKAKEEFQAALDATGRTVEEIRSYVHDNPELMGGLYRVPKDERYAGTAANFVTHVAELMT
jgi:predicted nucleotide-binding protein (sugar kinase/HSP70/actin superfamily)